MTKFFRICTIALAAGAVLSIAGAAAGGRLYSNIRNGVLRPIRWSLPSLAVEDDEGEHRNDGRTGIARGTGSVWDSPKVDVGDIDVGNIHTGLEGIPEELPPVTSLEKLDFELGGGNFRIVEGEGYGFSCEGSWIDSQIENGVWRIRTDVPLFSMWGDGRQCTITVPAGCTVEKLEWEVGAANVEVTAAITAEKADLEVGAGNLWMGALDVQKELDLEVGAGNADLYLAGSQADYRIKAEVAMGTISLDGRDLLTGMAGSCTKGSGSKKINAEVGMGCISLYTERIEE